MEQNNKNREIGEIRSDVKWLKTELADIKNNHLVSIYEKLDSVEKCVHERPTWLIAGVFTIMGGIIIGLATYLLTR